MVGQRLALLKHNAAGFFDRKIGLDCQVLFLCVDGQRHHTANLQAVVLLRVARHALLVFVVAILGLSAHDQLLVWVVELIGVVSRLQRRLLVVRG
jgi:hypothetical protein